MKNGLSRSTNPGLSNGHTVCIHRIHFEACHSRSKMQVYVFALRGIYAKNFSRRVVSKVIPQHKFCAISCAHTCHVIAHPLHKNCLLRL